MMYQWNQAYSRPLTGETLTLKTSNISEGARLYVSVKGFWGGCHEKTFIDVRVFNPHAPTNKNTSISNCYRKHENEFMKRELQILNSHPSLSLPLGVWRSSQQYSING